MRDRDGLEDDLIVSDDDGFLVGAVDGRSVQKENYSIMSCNCSSGLI